MYFDAGKSTKVIIINLFGITIHKAVQFINYVSKIDMHGSSIPEVPCENHMRVLKLFAAFKSLRCFSCMYACVLLRIYMCAAQIRRGKKGAVTDSGE